MRIRNFNGKKMREIGQIIQWKEFEDENAFLKKYVYKFVKKLPNFYKKMDVEKPNPETLYNILINFKPSADKLIKMETGHHRNLAIADLISDANEIYPTGILYKCGPNDYGRYGYNTNYHVCEIFIQIDNNGYKKLIYVDYFRSRYID